MIKNIVDPIGGGGGCLPLDPPLGTVGQQSTSGRRMEAAAVTGEGVETGGGGGGGGGVIHCGGPKRDQPTWPKEEYDNCMLMWRVCLFVFRS